MELKDFVAQALSQIIEGVREAQRISIEKGAIINPRIRPGDLDKTREYLLANTAEMTVVTTVEFDTAVTVNEGSELRVGGGLLKVISGGHTSRDETSTVSRIRFKVPVALPEQNKMN